MKAVLYAVKRKYGWEAQVSAAWEVDRMYWTDPDFRKCAAAYWQGDKRESEASRRIGTRDNNRYALVRLSHPLPLGIAVMARDRWSAQGGEADKGDPHRRLAATAKWAAARAGEPVTAEADQLGAAAWREQSDASTGLEWLNENGCRALLDMTEGRVQSDAEKRTGENEAAAMWTGAVCGESILSAAPGEGGSSPQDLPRYAREAADRLRGCGLLLAEAMTALDTDGATLLPALQLASLLGGVRFTSAVGPVQRRGWLGWLRGRAAEMRCRRCGSRGAALHRTPCAACGRQSCAYCEACLTMGRSRECGLLVIGASAAAGFEDRAHSSSRRTTNAADADQQAAVPINDGRAPSPSRQTPNAADVEQPTVPLQLSAPASSGQLQQVPSETSEVARTIPQIPARWGLSPAQQEAAESALTFLLKHRQEAAEIALAFHLKHQQGAVSGKRSSAGRGAMGWRCFLEPTALASQRWRGVSLWRRFLQTAMAAPRAAGSEFLLWAVTGAGKTEMMFPLLDAVLSAGGKVAVATPRRDVVLELAPRLAAAFPHVRQVVLYGGSEERLQLGELTLATTHQLIRFKEAFDLVVIDEVDAFPFHNDQALHFAAAEARARSGMTLLLSATPPAAMQRRARRGRLPHARVAVRHHRRPLPVPQRLTIPPLSRWAIAEQAGMTVAGSSKTTAAALETANSVHAISVSNTSRSSKTRIPGQAVEKSAPARATDTSKSDGTPVKPNPSSQPSTPGPRPGRLPAKLREAIRAAIQRGAQLFVFVPFIRQVEPLVRLLRQHASSFGIDRASIDGTSSHDLRRGEKVTAFRSRSIRLLVTTTILERGVTVPKSDVFVLDADKPLFDAASLVQMAGRAGRSADDPNGRVIFAASAWTNSQRGACKQIREMNAFARRKGFLIEDQK